MSTPLSMLTQRPIEIPAYDNRRIGLDEHLWLCDNMKALLAYYNALTPYCEGEPLEEFNTWVKEQRHREEIKLLDVSIFLALNESAPQVPVAEGSRPAPSPSEESGRGFQPRDWYSETKVADGLRGVLATVSGDRPDCSRCGPSNCYCDIASNE